MPSQRHHHQTTPPENLMSDFQSLAEEYAGITYRSCAASLVDAHNDRAEAHGFPKLFVPGRVCLSCGARVSILGTLPCGH